VAAPFLCKGSCVCRGVTQTPPGAQKVRVLLDGQSSGITLPCCVCGDQSVPVTNTIPGVE
jgi:hypothetical protein